MRMEADSLVVLGTGAAANSVCFKWLERRNEISERKGAPRATTYLACARFKFGSGLLGAARRVADCPVGIAGNHGRVAAFVLEPVYLVCARFKFGGGLLGAARCVADCPVGIAGNHGRVAAFVLEPGIPASRRKGALEAVGGQLDVRRKILTSRKKGARIPAKLKNVGHYVLRAASLGRENSKSKKGPHFFGVVF